MRKTVVLTVFLATFSTKTSIYALARSFAGTEELIWIGMAMAVFPIFYSFYLSFFSLKLTRPHRVPFVWFDNYVQLLGDELFWGSVGRTVYFSVISVAVIALLAMLVALLLNEAFRGRRILSAILLIPWAIPTVANGLMWKWIYDSGYGALNGLLLQLPHFFIFHLATFFLQLPLPRGQLFQFATLLFRQSSLLVFALHQVRQQAQRVPG